MSEKEKTENKEANHSTEDNKPSIETNEENILETEDESSGAEVYIEYKNELEEEKSQELKEITEDSEEDEGESEEVDEDSEEDSEEEIDEDSEEDEVESEEVDEDSEEDEDEDSEEDSEEEIDEDSEEDEVESEEVDEDSEEDEDEDSEEDEGESEEIDEDSEEDSEEDEAESEEVDEDEDSEEDEEVDYEKIKQDLLKEYTENKNLEDQDSSKEVEDHSGDHVVEEENRVSGEHNGLEDDNRDKVSIDDNFEIEDIQESLDGDVINRPKSSNQENQEITPDVDQGFSKVAISKGSSIAILVGLVLVFVYIIYKILQPSQEELDAQKSTINKNLPIVTPVEDPGQTIVVPDIPDFPEMPSDLTVPAPKALPTPPVPSTLDLPALSAPPLPPSPSMAEVTPPMAPPPIGGGVKPLQGSGVNIAAIDKEAEARAAADAARKKARMKSGMMVGGSGGGGSKNKNSNGQSLSILERNTDQTVATHIGDLQRVIAEGKVIDAVLETAINTDLPGAIRAVVSRDVYSESGTNVLINRGSRLIGTYSSDITFGQARVQIVWSRVIRPDGIDIAIDSPGIDSIGRAGSAGEVDNHILRNFTTAMMVSLINIGVAEYADSNGSSSSSSTTTTTNTDGSTTSTDDNTALDDAYDDAVDNISSIGTDVIEKTMDMPPTITIDQGTSLKVFVKQDLVFPGRSANLTKIVE